MAVSSADLDAFKLYVQYATAAYCNIDQAPGTPVACRPGGCPTVEGNNAAVLASFS